MIIEFQVKNYLSFQDLTTFSMVGMKSFKEHEPDNIIEFDGKLKILVTYQSIDLLKNMHYFA